MKRTSMFRTELCTTGGHVKRKLQKDQSTKFWIALRRNVGRSERVEIGTGFSACTTLTQLYRTHDTGHRSNQHTCRICLTAEAERRENATYWILVLLTQRYRKEMQDHTK